MLDFLFEKVEFGKDLLGWGVGLFLVDDLLVAVKGEVVVIGGDLFARGRGSSGWCGGVSFGRGGEALAVEDVREVIFVVAHGWGSFRN